MDVYFSLKLLGSFTDVPFEEFHFINFTYSLYESAILKTVQYYYISTMSSYFNAYNNPLPEIIT